jgi:hypothetical protein
MRCPAAIALSMSIVTPCTSAICDVARCANAAGANARYIVAP